MHPLLGTLNLAADPGTESSVHDLHPVWDAASPSSRGIPFLLALGLTPLLIYGLTISLISHTSRQAVQGAMAQARKSISLLLFEAPTPEVKAPARNLVGPEAPGGAGHREGTDTLDPRLVAYTSALSQPSDAIDPDELGPSPKAERVYLSLNPALPPQTGGNGLAMGTGRDSAKGPGGLMPPQKVFDFQLIPTRQVPVYHQLRRGEAADSKEPVRVHMLIGEDGVPFEAKVLSGPPFLHHACLEAALKWRFEPLGPHGLKAPISLVLTFYPTLLPPR